MHWIADSFEGANTIDDSFKQVCQVIDSMPADFREKFTHFLMSMPYPQFLKTYYWRSVRHEVLRRANHICVNCRKERAFHVHHGSYRAHGQEHMYLEELRALCRDCHEAMHQKGGSVHPISPDRKLNDLIADIASMKTMGRE